MPTIVMAKEYFEPSRESLVNLHFHIPNEK
jgi:hypothetical protein